MHVSYCSFGLVLYRRCEAYPSSEPGGNAAAGCNLVLGTDDRMCLTTCMATFLYARKFAATCYGQTESCPEDGMDSHVWAAVWNACTRITVDKLRAQMHAFSHQQIKLGTRTHTSQGHSNDKKSARGMG